MTANDNIETLEDFLHAVKYEELRSDYIQKQVSENVVVELSVGPFEFGDIFLRVFVDQSEISVSEGKYFQRLFKTSDEFTEAYDEVVSRIEAENDTDIENAHSWEAEPTKKVENHPSFPPSLDRETTNMFSDTVTLRDDVTVSEAILSNRTN